METTIEISFRFLMYVVFGFFLEIVYAVTGIERSVGAPIKRRMPKKYLEGWVSLYMIPIHGIGMLVGFENVIPYVIKLHFSVRFLIWAIMISAVEALTGWLYDKAIGFYSWDYYADSPYKVFKRGYTLWTLVPQWGIAGMILEVYVQLLVHISPHVSEFFMNYWK